MVFNVGSFYFYQKAIGSFPNLEINPLNVVFFLEGLEPLGEFPQQYRSINFPLLNPLKY